MRRLAIVLVCAATAVALAACGKPDTSDPNTPEPTGQSGTGTLGEGPSDSPAPTPSEGGGGGGGTPAPPQPQSTIDSRVGFAWISNATASAELSTSYQYNSAGGAISVVHGGTGQYTVKFDGLGSPGGVAHAQAYGDTPNFCTVGGWYKIGSDQTIGVNCYTPAGVAADTRFTVSFAVGSMGSARFSYLWANEPANTAKYKPEASYAYDPVKSSDLTVQRTNTGRYEVFLPASGPLSAPWTFQVTAYGSASQCKLASFSSGNRKAQIACRNAGGNFTDTRFSLSFASGASFLGRTDRPFGAYSEDNDGLENPETGVYVVRATNLGQAKGQVVAVARGTAATYCHVRSWGPSGADLSANVVCYNPGGTPATSGFEVAVTL